MPQTLYDIYCGPAPDAVSLAWRWNFDPILLAALALLGFILLRDGSGRTFTVLGLVVLAVAFVSPLCALASALFSARVLHHILLVAVAAPFLTLALRHPAWLARAPHAAFAAHTVLFWLWHSPASFDIVTLPFVLTLVKNPQAVLRECVRVVRPDSAILIAGRISRGGSFQTRIESAIDRLARRCGLRAAFHLSRSERWCRREKLAELQKLQNLDTIGFFKLLTLRPLGKETSRSLFHHRRALIGAVR